MLEALWQDVRFATRSLLRAPGVALVAILSLAFGIGANATVFSLVQAVEFPSFIYPDSGRIVFFESANLSRGLAGMPVSAPDALDIAGASQTLEPTALTADQSSVLRVGDRSVRVSGRRVGPRFFELFGVQPILGRVHAASEGPESIVISAQLWRGAFMSDGAIVNRRITLDGGFVTVVGVMPPRFDSDADFWTPLGSGASGSRRDDRQFTLFARLRAGASLAAADQEARQISQRLAADHPATNKDWSTYPILLSRLHGRDSRGAFLILQAAVGLVLLIACANIANVLLARGTTRRHEMAVRVSLGATRARLLRALLVESTLLSLAGGAVGVLIAMWGIRAARTIDGFPDAIDPRLNPFVLAFTAAASVATGVICGIVPAIRAARVEPERVLRADAVRGSSDNRAWLRSVLVASQIALALVLGTCAALMVQSLVNRQRVDLGFRPAGAVRADLALPADRYARPDVTRAEISRILDQLNADPDVSAAGIVTWALPTAAGAQRQLTLPDEASRALGTSIPRGVEAVSPSYFDAIGTPVRSGRAFTAADTAVAGSVAIVNDTLARHLWPNRNPVGERLRLGAAAESVPVVTVVGVVGSIRRSGMHDSVPARVYLPFEQYPNPRVTVVVRARSDVAAAARSLDDAVRRADGALLVENLRTLEDDVARFVAPIRMITLLLATFGIAGVLLAGLGVFGTMSYTVSQRRREMAIRTALGATRAEIVRMVVFGALTVTLAGIVVGGVAAFVAARAIAALLFGVTPGDSRTFLSIMAMLIALATLAAYRPAREAASVDPMAVLRL
jgi:putative ABC transport system permease protein